MDVAGDSLKLIVAAVHPHSNYFYHGFIDVLMLNEQENTWYKSSTFTRYSIQHHDHYTQIRKVRAETTISLRHRLGNYVLGRLRNSPLSPLSRDLHFFPGAPAALHFAVNTNSVGFVIQLPVRTVSP